MTVEIRVQSVKPLRHTFGHIAHRFGDKPASRYQEGTYDLQSEVNHHYKPLWDPEREIYDTRRTAIVMRDWYALKDPRQHYYGSWTIARARQQESAERQIELVREHDWLRRLGDEARQGVILGLLPLRYVEWGANTSLGLVAAYGYGTALTQAAAMGMMDRLGLAQHLSRIGLLLDGQTGASLKAARTAWLEDAAWQDLRREVENLFVRRDPIEVLVAQSLVQDALVDALVLRRFEPAWSGAGGDAAVMAMLLDFPLRWHEESARWVDAVVKVMAAESESNRALLRDWADAWRSAFAAALRPLARRVLGEAAGDAALRQAEDALQTRLARLGLAPDAR